jgi:hypothetical protein
MWKSLYIHKTSCYYGDSLFLPIESQISQFRFWIAPGFDARAGAKVWGWDVPTCAAMAGPHTCSDPGC